MRIRTLRLGVAVVCIGAVMATASTPAFGAVAIPTGADSSNSAILAAGVSSPIPDTERVPESSHLYPLNAYVTYSPNGYVVDAPDSVLSQVPGSDLEQLNAYLRSVDGLIASGDLAMMADATAWPSADSEPSAGSSIAELPSWKIKGDHYFIQSHWYGIELGMDSYLTNKAEGWNWTGSGIAAFATLLGGGAVAGYIAAALAVSAGALQACQHSNGWTYIYWLNWSGTGLPVGGWVCNPFG